MVKTDWLRLLGYVTGLVNQELLLKNEYLVAENRILKAHIRGRLLLSDGEKATLAEIAKRLGRPALAQIASVAKPDTILAWFRELIAKKFDGSSSAAPAGVHGSDRSLRTWWSSWLEVTPVGVTTALSVPWPIWGTRSPIKRSETFFGGEVFGPPPNARRAPHGRTSSVRT